MGETLKRRVGPLPMWAWALIFVILLAAYLSYRKGIQMKAAQAAAQQQGMTSTNLGTTPVSNITTAAQPMPVQLGDTFVSVPQNISTTQSVGPTTVPITNNVQPAAVTVQPAPPPAAPAAPQLPLHTLEALPNPPGPPMTAADWAALKDAVAKGGGAYLTALNNQAKQAYWGT